MHVIFIPYGKRSEVEVLLRDMESQKHKLIMRKGKKVMNDFWIEPQIRILPFGVYEYVFPKESMDVVLKSLLHADLEFKEDRYNVGKLKLKVLRNILKCEKIPKFKEDKHYLWIKDHVTVVLLGIRKDGEITDPDGKYKGWTHEAI